MADVLVAVVRRPGGEVFPDLDEQHLEGLLVDVVKFYGGTESEIWKEDGKETKRG